jgi:hypothetical protein
MKVYVSLTSIFDNQNILLLTLMSIRNQTVIPDKCFIFLSEDEKFKDKGFPDKKITNPGLIYFLNQNKVITPLRRKMERRLCHNHYRR